MGTFPPFFIIALISIGCLLVFFPWPQCWPWLLALAVACAALGNSLSISARARLFPGMKEIGRASLCLALGLGFGLGCLFILKAREQVAFSGVETGSITAYTGTIVSDSAALPAGKTSWELDLAAVMTRQGRFSAVGRVKVSYGEPVRLYQGEAVVIQGKLAQVTAAPGIQFTGKAQVLTQLGFQNPVSSWRMGLRKYLDTAIDRIGYPASELFRGLFLGEKADFPATLALGFTKTGTLHLLALSGFNVGIIYSFLWLLLLPLPGRYLKLGLIGLAILFYLFLIGLEPSLFRATIMLLLTWLSLVIRQKADPLTILGGALLFILAVEPAAAFSLGLQLSFLAMCGIILFTTGVNRFFSPYLPSWLALPLASSLAAQITTLPLVLLTFGIYYPVNILVTLLLIPLTTVYMGAGILALFLFALAPALPGSVNGVSAAAWYGPAEAWIMFWQSSQAVCRWFIHALYNIILAINDFFSVWPGIQVKTDSLALQLSMCVYSLLVIGWVVKNRAIIPKALL